ncbi:MAG: hypothetical protein ACP5HG_15340 [Anaerolineae bacterium]
MERPSKLDAILGQSVVAGMVTGFLALGAAIFAFFGNDWMATGICLAAAGLSFGLVANAMLRD